MVYNYTKPRRPVMASMTGPGPCYGMPGLTGDKLPHDPRSVHNKAPAYSFRLKHGKWSDDCSPGPKYGLSPQMLRGGKEEKPAYSITGRPRTAVEALAPGPAAYAPEKCGQQAYYRHPTYAFGLRTAGRRTDVTPGTCCQLIRCGCSPLTVHVKPAVRTSVNNMNITLVSEIAKF